MSNENTTIDLESPSERETEPSDKVSGSGSPSCLLRFGYACGHAQNDLCSAMYFSYLLVYLELTGLSPVGAGVVLIVGQLVDGLSTPLAGTLSDRLTCGKPGCFFGLAGRRKSWYIGGLLLVSATFWALFTPYPDAVQPVAYYTIANCMFQVGWATVQVSHMTIVPELTPLLSERTILNSIRFAVTVGSSITVYVLVWIFAAIGGDPTSDEDDDAALSEEKELLQPRLQIISYIVFLAGVILGLVFICLVQEKDTRGGLVESAAFETKSATSESATADAESTTLDLAVSNVEPATSEEKLATFETKSATFQEQAMLEPAASNVEPAASNVEPATPEELTTSSLEPATPEEEPAASETESEVSELGKSEAVSLTSAPAASNVEPATSEEVSESKSAAPNVEPATSEGESAIPETKYEASKAEPASEEEYDELSGKSLEDNGPIDEEPVGEEPVEEEPVDEEPVDTEPVDTEPVDEAPVDEAPVDEGPLDEEPLDDELGDDEPIDNKVKGGEPSDEELEEGEPSDEEIKDEEIKDEEIKNEEECSDDELNDEDLSNGKEGEKCSGKTLKDWFGTPGFYGVTSNYTVTRLCVNSLQVYLPFFVLTNMPDSPSAVATVPLTTFVGMCLSSALAPRLSSLMTDAAWLYSVGASCLLIGAAVLLFPAETSNSNVYVASALLGLGSAQLMVTSQTQVCELIGSDPNGGVVFGINSFCDKVSTGLVIFLVQQSAENSSSDDGLERLYKLTASCVPIGCAFLGLLAQVSVPKKIRARDSFPKEGNIDVGEPKKKPLEQQTAPTEHFDHPSSFHDEEMVSWISLV